MIIETVRVDALERVITVPVDDDYLAMDGTDGTGRIKHSDYLSAIGHAIADDPEEFSLAPLDENGLVPTENLPASLTGGQTFKGAVAYSALPASSTSAGDYYVITSSGTIYTIAWLAGDSAIWTGTAWARLGTSRLLLKSLYDFGATGDGVADDYAALLAALAAAAPGTQVYLPAGTFRLATSITIGVTKRLLFDAGAILAPDSTKVVTINGTVSAGAQQIFGGLGTISWGTAPRMDRIYAAWWGADGDWAGGTVGDSAAAINKALASGTASRRMDVILLPGQYLATSTITIPGRCRLIGTRACTSIYFRSGSNNAYACTFTSGADNITLRNIQLVNYPDGVHTGTSGVTLPSSNSECLLENCSIEGFNKYGFFANDNSNYLTIRNCRFLSNRNDVTVSGGDGTAMARAIYTLNCNVVRLENIRFGENDRAWYIDHGNAIKITGCSTENAAASVYTGTGAGGFHMICANTHGTVIDDLYCESITTGSGGNDSVFEINSVKGLKVTNSIFSGDVGGVRYSKYFFRIYGNSRGVEVSDCYFINPITGVAYIDSGTGESQPWFHDNAYTIEAGYGGQGDYYLHNDIIGLFGNGPRVRIDTPHIGTWALTTIASGAVTSANFTVNGARVDGNDCVSVNVDGLGSSDLIVTGRIVTDGTVRIFIQNLNGGVATINATVNVTIAVFKTPVR